MSNRGFEFHGDPRLPDNVFVVETDDRDDAMFFEHGTLDGEMRAKVVDLRANHDDERVTELSYEFVYRNGVYVHDYTGVHRHGPDRDPETGGGGPCEHVPPAEEPAPDIVIDILVEALDAPVAGGEADE